MPGSVSHLLFRLKVSKGDDEAPLGGQGPNVKKLKKQRVRRQSMGDNKGQHRAYYEMSIQRGTRLEILSFK